MARSAPIRCASGTPERQPTMPDSSLRSSSTVLIRFSSSSLSTSPRRPSCAQASALTCTARTGLRGSRGAVPTLNRLSATFPAWSDARTTTVRAGARAKATVKRPSSSSDTGLPFTRTRASGSTAPRNSYAAPRRASSEPLVIRTAGGRLSTVNVQLRRSENAPPARETPTVCSPSASRPGRKTILPSLAVTREETGLPSTVHVVAARSPASPATVNSSVDMASRPRSVASGPVASSPPPPLNAVNAAIPTSAAPPATAYSLRRLRAVSRARAAARRAAMSSQRSSTARAAARTSPAAPLSTASSASRRSDAVAAGRRVLDPRRDRSVSSVSDAIARANVSRSPLAPLCSSRSAQLRSSAICSSVSCAGPSAIVTRYAFAPLRYSPW